MHFVQKEVSQVLGPPTSFALLPPPYPQLGTLLKRVGVRGQVAYPSPRGWPSWELRVGHGQPPRVGMPGHAWPRIYLPCLFLSSYTNPRLLKKKEQGQRELQTTWQSLRVPLFSGQRIFFEVGATSKPPNSQFLLPRPFRDRELTPLPNQGQP